MDCSPWGSSIHGILQARILEWVIILFSRESFRPRDQTRVYYIAGELFNLLSHQGNKAYYLELLSNAKNYLEYTVQLDSSSLRSFFHYSLSLDWDFPTYLDD